MDDCIALLVEFTECCNASSISKYFRIGELLDEVI